jgi:hypothetical protein
MTASENHGSRYTHGFHTGLAMGMDMGRRLLTYQKPYPYLYLLVMQLCHTVTQPNMAVRATHTSFALSLPPTTNPGELRADAYE